MWGAVQRGGAAALLGAVLLCCYDRSMEKLVVVGVDGGEAAQAGAGGVPMRLVHT